MAGLLISDGFNLTYTIQARGCFPALTVDYRPAMPQRVYAWKKAAAKISSDTKSSPEKVNELDFDNDAAFVAAHLVNWDCGEPLTSASLKRLPYPYFLDLLNVVLGYITPDPKTGESEQEEAEKN